MPQNDSNLQIQNESKVEEYQRISQTMAKDLRNETLFRNSPKSLN